MTTIHNPCEPVPCEVPSTNTYDPPLVGTSGQHLVVDLRGCSPERLDDAGLVAALLRRAAEVAGATVLGVHVHRFAPCGVAGVAVLAESHLSIHTWPETGYAAADFYTCGNCRPDLAQDVLQQGLGADRAAVMEIARGQPEAVGSLRLQRFVSESVVPRP